MSLKGKEEMYLNALIALKRKIDENPKFSISKFSKDHKLSSIFSTTVQKLNIVEQIEKGISSTWRWTTDEPTIEMAENLFNTIREDTKKRVNKSYRDRILRREGRMVNSHDKQLLRRPVSELLVMTHESDYNKLVIINSDNQESVISIESYNDFINKLSFK